MQRIVNRIRWVNVPKFSHIVSKQNVQIALKDELLTLTFPFILGPKLFFVHSQYTFNTLVEQLQLEESTKVDVEFVNNDLNTNSNLYNYILNDKSNKPVKMFIQDEEFTLTPAFQTRESQILNKAQLLKQSPIKKYLDMCNQGIDPSHANTLSWLLNQLNISKNFTQKEITEAFTQALPILKQPTKDNLYEIQHIINVLEAEICKHKEQLNVMISEAEKTGYRWLKILFFLSVLQIGAFYYGIYMVDEWGWNVCEPVTYTLQCLTVFMGMIFYIRYRKQRDSETIRWAFTFRKQIKERNWKDRWNHLNTLINLKEEQLNQMKLQKMIYFNRMNYHFYVQQTKQQKK